MLCYFLLQNITLQFTPQIRYLNQINQGEIYNIFRFKEDKKLTKNFIFLHLSHIHIQHQKET